MKKFVYLILLILLISCQLDMFKATPVFNGEVAKFVKDGYSVPLYGTPSYCSNDYPSVGGKKMFQVNANNSFVMELVNPGKLALEYTIKTNHPEFFQSISGSTVASGKINTVNYNFNIPILLKNVADKKTIKLTLSLSSPMRSYETPDIPAIYVNSRPSKIIPLADSTGSPVANNVWDPIITVSEATIYWDYSPVATDTDIQDIEILYTIDGAAQKPVRIPYNSATKKFGTNSFTVAVPVGKKASFSVNVFDDENLDSGIVATGKFTPQRAENPEITCAGNKVTLTPSAGTTIYSTLDSQPEQISKTAIIYELTGSHTISVYASKPGLFDSIPVVEEYNAEYSIAYDLDYGTNHLSNLATYTVETLPITLEDAWKSGYAFGGWYDKIDFSGSAVTHIAQGSTGDITLYAKFVGYGLPGSLDCIEKRDLKPIVGKEYLQTATYGSPKNFTHTISDFSIGQYEVTYELWYAVRLWAISGENGYKFANAGVEGGQNFDPIRPAGTPPSAGAKHEPVTNINWRDAIVWCNAYSEMSDFVPCYTYSSTTIKDSNSTACDNAICNWFDNGYRLPSEGEWQYAASYVNVGNWTDSTWASGATADYNDATECQAVAWYEENSQGFSDKGAGLMTRVVGGKRANDLGLYDMSGNVWEWCWDWDGNYPNTQQNDYHGSDSGNKRIRRGGSFSEQNAFLQVGYRTKSIVPSFTNIDIGFRVAKIK